MAGLFGAERAGMDALLRLVEIARLRNPACDVRHRGRLPLRAGLEPGEQVAVPFVVEVADADLCARGPGRHRSRVRRRRRFDRATALQPV
jgi:hypothetical protein